MHWPQSSKKFIKFDFIVLFLKNNTFMGFPINKLCLCFAIQNLTCWCCDCRNYGFSGRLLLLLLLDNERSLIVVLTYKREWTMKIIWLAVFSGISWREIEVFKLSCFWFVIDNIDVFSDSLNLVVCNNWFAIGCLISLWFLQPGPCDFPHQCLIKRNKKTSTFYLYLAFTTCEYVHENNFWNDFLLYFFRSCFTLTNSNFDHQVTEGIFKRGHFRGLNL